MFIFLGNRRKVCILLNFQFANIERSFESFWNLNFQMHFTNVLKPRCLHESFLLMFVYLKKVIDDDLTLYE